MAKKVTNKYSPTEEEMKAMHICNNNNLAYIQQAVSNTQFCIVKYEIDDYLRLNYLPEDKTKLGSITNRLLFNDYDASKKVMELYVQHSKRFI
jgi:hypothetical protein